MEFVQELAKQKGGKCLSKAYKNIDSVLLWKCAKGHEWETTLYQIKNRNTWCPLCSAEEKRNEERQKSLEGFKNIARQKSGECLSDIYIDHNTKMLWQCAKGHKWEAVPNHVKNSNSWCPYCAGIAKLTIEEMQKMAEAKGGKCLSKVYVNSYTKLLWKCSVGHRWETKPSVIRQSNSWCPICAKNKRNKNNQ